jgi:hypothetical protein
MKKIRTMKLQLFTLLLLMMLLTATQANTQMYTLNWNTSFSPSWSNGALSRTATNIGGSGITAAVNITKYGGTWQPSVYTGTATPTKNGDYKTGPWSPPNNLMIALDYATAADYTDIIVTFTPGVFNLNFYIGDIDRHFKDRNDFMDEILIEGNGGVLPVTYTRYMNDPAFPDQIEVSGNTVRVGSNASLSGNCGPAGYPANFDVMEQAGDVRVNFGPTIVNTLRIKYGSAAGVMANPSLQAIAISNMSFSKSSLLAVTVPFANPDAPSLDDNNNVRLMNNPFKDNIQYALRSSKDQKIVIKLYNSQGAVMYRSEAQLLKGSNNRNLPLNAVLPKGVYLLEIITSDRERLFAKPVKR